MQCFPHFTKRQYTFEKNTLKYVFFEKEVGTDGEVRFV